MRPKRLYIDSKNRYYFIVDGKKKYIKVPPGMSQKQVQTINIKNIIGAPARRIKPKKKRAKVYYTKRTTKTKDITPVIQQGLPVYFFTPRKQFMDIGAIASRADDTSTKNLIDLLKGATPVLKTEKGTQTVPPVETSKPKGTKTFEVPTDVPPPVPPRPKGKPRPREPFETPVKETLRKLKESVLTPEQIKFRDFLEKEKETRKEFVKKAREAEPVPVPRDPKLRARYDIKEKTIDKNLIRALIQDEFMDPINIDKFVDEASLDDWKAIAQRVGVDKDYSQKDSLRNAIIRKMKEETELAGMGIGDDGLYNDEIQTIMKKRIKHLVPVVPSDKVDELLEYVRDNDKEFSAIVNTDPSSSGGRHWTCIYIDNRDDFPSCEFFDPLCENEQPPPRLLEVMRQICKKMNPEVYFKYKFNKLRRQSHLTSNCAFHCMKFLEDRINGIPFSVATGWDDYQRQKGNGFVAPDDSVDGEKDIQKYENKIRKDFNMFL